MRTTILILIVITSSLFVFAQSGKVKVGLDFDIKADTIKTRIYPLKEKPEGELKTLILKMKYGDEDIINPKDAVILNDMSCKIFSIDLIYTHPDKTFNQEWLNKKRLAELYFLAPDVFSQPVIHWSFVEQLGYKNPDEASSLFHGFVIKYAKIEVYKPKDLKEMIARFKNPEKKDTSFFKLFNRFFKGSDELIAVDMTGSMSPYYQQVFTWLCLKSNKKELYFSFFNDGDNKYDDAKRMGNVGGVYLLKSNNVDTMIGRAYKCLVSGSGGDSPENNIEAALKGLKNYPNLKKVVMVVDNWADMRDYSMIEHVKVPVHVILCGTNLCGRTSPANPQYLDLARKTGGSVHTMEEDLEDLSKKKEGDEIKIAGNIYVIRGGRFMLK